MTVTDFDFREQPAKRPDHKPLSLALLVSALVVLAIACLVMAAPTVATALQGTLEAQQSRLFACAITDSEHDRLACYDRIGSETLRPPARGANAPLGLGARSALTR